MLADHDDSGPYWDSVLCLAELLNAVVLYERLYLPWVDDPSVWRVYERHGSPLDQPAFETLRAEGLLVPIGPDHPALAAVRNSRFSDQGVDAINAMLAWIDRRSGCWDGYHGLFPMRAARMWVRFDPDAFNPLLREKGPDGHLWGSRWVEDVPCGEGIRDGFSQAVLPYLAQGFFVRGMLYAALARSLGVPYLPHPFRRPLVTAMTWLGFHPGTPTADSLEQWTAEVEPEDLESGPPEGGPTARCLRLPIASLLPRVLERCGRLDQWLDMAFELRDLPEAREYRRFQVEQLPPGCRSDGPLPQDTVRTWTALAVRLASKANGSADPEAATCALFVPTGVSTLFEPLLPVQPHWSRLWGWNRWVREVYDARRELTRLGLEPLAVPAY